MIGTRGDVIGTTEFHRARTLLPLLVAVSILIALALPVSASAVDYSSEELEFLRLINDHRERNGLDGLLLSDTVSVAAERHSHDMGKYGFFSHTTEQSDWYPTGSSAFDRMAAEGYRYNTYLGENIAAGPRSAQHVFDEWRASASHNRNMLNGDFRVIGIGLEVVSGSAYGYYWTTDFGGYVDSTAHDPFGGDSTTTTESTTTTTASTTTTTAATTTTTTTPTTTTSTTTTTTAPTSTTTTTTSTTTEPSPTVTVAPDTTIEPSPSAPETPSTTTTSSTTTSTTSTTTPGIPTAEPVAVPVTGNTFSDVPADHRFHTEISGLSAAGVVSGYADGTFRPDQAVLRAQFAKVVIQTAGAPADDFGDPDHACFLDVTYEGTPYPYSFVERAAHAGYVNGFPDRSFRPFSPITRAQLALMLVRAGGGALESPPPGYDTGFADTTLLSDEARSAIATARFNGILSGKTDSSFDPHSPATRGHVAKMTFNFIGLLR